MGSDIKLVVPEDDWGEDLLREYYEYRQNKRREINPDGDWPSAEETVEFQIAKKQLDDNLFILESLPRKIRPFIDTEEFYNLLGDAPDRNVIYAKDIEKLMSMLRDAKRDLIQEADDKMRREINIEAGPVAVCEFALERDYGVRLSE